MGEWHQLAQLISKDKNCTFDEKLGRILLAASQGNEPILQTELGECRKETMAAISATSIDSYDRVYPFLVRLHVLSEIEGKKNEK